MFERLANKEVTCCRCNMQKWDLSIKTCQMLGSGGEPTFDHALPLSRFVPLESGKPAPSCVSLMFEVQPQPLRS
jgi:hypothetical protein